MKIKKYNPDVYGQEAFFFTPVIACIKDESGHAVWFCWFHFMFYILFRKQKKQHE